MSVSLRGQVALVTGASSGIGLAVARSLAREGAAVAINYNAHGDVAEQATSEIIAEGGTAKTFQADVSSEVAVIGLIQAVTEAFGALDIVVANAGAQKDAPILEMSLNDWNSVIGLDLTGSFLCGREAIRQFRTQGRRGVSRSVGKLLFTSSVHEVIPWAGHANYAAAKGGLGMLMRSLAQEVAGEGIRVNGIAPGAIRTPINREQTEGEAGERLLTLIPYGRIGEVEDVARAAVWLVSDEADYVVGTTLFVDGGMTLHAGFRDNG